ncbi:glycosyltransferase family 2 protein [Candidatus Roizmanbacteria bacterium]|nr:glycosyltransferase family 2 protein [Candidatus Roizmanbacteria bacterium]
MMMVSVIIPVYNEENNIGDCLSSLASQSYQSLEVIVIDDGSSDKTLKNLSEFHPPTGGWKFKIYKQKHLGPASARNLGVKHAQGEILVFVDADMTFGQEFIAKLTAPIRGRNTKGTFTKDEFVSNWQNAWARCWNYNEGLSSNRRIPDTYPDTSPVFRAILKSEFEKVGGFDSIGFTDDWTLSRKLGYRATLAQGAICYHQNPHTLKEVYIQARWIGKNEFISGNHQKRLVSLLRYNALFQTIRGIFIALKYMEIKFVLFQLIYYLGIYVSVWNSYLGEEKYK